MSGEKILSASQESEAGGLFGRRGGIMESSWPTASPTPPSFRRCLPERGHSAVERLSNPYSSHRNALGTMNVPKVTTGVSQGPSAL